MRSRLPERTQRNRCLERNVGSTCPLSFVERHAEVVLLEIEKLEPRGLRWAVKLRACPVSKIQVVRGMTASGLSSVSKRIGRILADRLQHPVAAVREAEEALLDQRLEGVEVSLCDFFGRVERAAAGKDREAGEEQLFLG